jgi:hypothetical protein
MKTISCLALLFAIAYPALPLRAAEEKKPAKAEKATAADAEKKNTYPLYGEVVAITSRTLTIKGGEEKEDRKYTISAATEILKSEKPATVEDVKVGQWVGGLLEKAEAGNDKVLKLNLSVKQKDKSATKPAAKKEAPAKADEEAPKKKAA